ncbi:ImmA/IrrE family metallo-endopeptidase [Seohaeicola zhoushanensis]|uniref:IrrE N-terminal-like domain-containing protein n=1 Tax=Seohaeicola zhoushanensis TaxID=1569283 RepID=A0A8J3M8P5_9RHOB|nr:ImmA/IrrE family metallo-endopeptidase [Seohaeicola zhoushanensis]GHF60601.1 hypothetical protein GCM10017056_35150 [Seohaeicola zhoushanensis]
MELSRFDLAEISAPRRLGQMLHQKLGAIDGAVPIVEIARALDIAEVQLDLFDGFEGMLLTDTRRSTGAILANTRHGNRRARFTVAHELGHFLLERHMLSDDGGFRCLPVDLREYGLAKQHQRQEAEANTFAGEVLAPVARVKPFCSEDPDIRIAQELRDQLDISLEATLRRIIDLSPHALAAVWSVKGRIRYSIKSKAFPYITCNKGTAVPQTTTAFRVITAGKRGATRMDETHPLAWTGRPDIALREQTRVGKDGHAITLLWADLPDEDDDYDGELPELGTPGFR